MLSQETRPRAPNQFSPSRRPLRQAHASITNGAACRSSNCDPSRHRFCTETSRPDYPEPQYHHRVAEVTRPRLDALWHLPFVCAPSWGVLEALVSWVARTGPSRVPRGLRHPQEAVESCTAPAALRSTRLRASKGLKAALGRRSDLWHDRMVYHGLGIAGRYTCLPQGRQHIWCHLAAQLEQLSATREQPGQTG